LYLVKLQITPQYNNNRTI